MLQAFVTEGVKPLIDSVITYGAGHFYVSQSDKGGLVFGGGGTDGWNSYAQRGNLPVAEDVLSAGLTLMPALSRLKVLRQWGGVMDMTMDNAPIISKTRLQNLFINAAGAMAASRPSRRGNDRASCRHWRAASADHAFRSQPLRRRRAIDERGTGPYPWLH